ncbi:MAG: DUF4368 domain-containing protein [Oscillospiraceae bacterium]|nr:DUF4368 domain-containing protein [Oscillospiraceae bacterium]
MENEKRRFRENAATLLNELIDRIEVYDSHGTGKDKTQKVVIYSFCQ